MKVISFINMKGGVGKTTLATNVCRYLATNENKRVLLVDIDPQFNATQCFMSGDKYIEYCSQKRDTICNIFEPNVVKRISSVDGEIPCKERTFKDIKPLKIKDNLYILPGNLELFKIEISAQSGCVNRLHQYLKEINAIYKFDYVIIDTPPTPSIWMTSALIASDYYMIPVKADPLSLTGIDLLRSIIRQKNENFDLHVKCLGLVLMMTEENTRVYGAARKNLETHVFWKKYLFKWEIPKSINVAEHQLNQEFILDTGNANVKTALSRIVNEMLSRIK